jgi:hypothetical protein
MIQELLEKYKDQSPRYYGVDFIEKCYPVSAVISMLEEQKQALNQHDVSSSLPLTEVVKCGKCELLGDVAPCDECYTKGNDN